jgi:DNA-binding SARP family transcriptional activator/pimeloyl-ACP methyl ester carboxylesterase
VPALRLFCLGPPRLERDGRPVEIGLRKAWALLVYLAVTKQAHSRDALAALLWPESDQSSARASLRRTLHQLSQLLDQPVIAAGPETISLASEAGVWLDVDAFLAHLSAGQPAAQPTGTLTAERRRQLAEAATLYRDDFLAGFSLPGCPAFDEWQFFQRENLRQLFAGVAQQLAQAWASEGDYETAILHARRWVALDPLHEPAQRQLMRLYARAGQPAAALRQYQECARSLQAELGVQPQPETTELFESIRHSRALAAPVESTAVPEVRYVQSGEVHIAYQVLGQGPVDLVFIGGFISHLEQTWEEPGLASFHRHLAESARLILFDKRGVGLSDRVGYPPSLEQTIEDVLAVMGAVGSRQVVLMGVSEGGPACILMAALYPERVSALVLYGTAPKFTRSADYPWALTASQWDAWLEQLVKGWGGPVDIEYFAPSRAGDPGLRQRWAHLLRSGSSPGGIKAVLEVEREIDVRPALPAIHVPTLILHRTGDRMMRIEGARYLAGQIPGARFVELPGADHWWFVGETAPILSQVDAFLKALGRWEQPEQVLATILATECVSLEPGLPGQARRDSYRALAQREVARFGGHWLPGEVAPLLAAFNSPSPAIRCAAELREAARAGGLTGRTGLHAGECQRAGGRLSGPGLQIAAQVMAQAAPGEILISDTVRGLVVGAGFALAARGEPGAEDNAGGGRLFALA